MNWNQLTLINYAGWVNLWEVQALTQKGASELIGATLFSSHEAEP